MEDASHVEPGKIGIVQNYLYHEFQHCSVYTFAEGQEAWQTYVIHVDGGMERYRLSLTYEFLRDTANILLELRERHAADRLRHAARRALVVTKDGMREQ